MSSSPSEGRKDDHGKLDWTLLWDGFPDALRDVVDVLDHAVTRRNPPYEAHNWKRVPDGVHRYKAALLRHLHEAGHDNLGRDNDTGISHLAHAVCCLLMMMQRIKDDQ